MGARKDLVYNVDVGDVQYWSGNVWTSLGVPAGGAAPKGALYLTLSTNATLTNERVFTPAGGLSGTDNGAGSTYDLIIANNGVTDAKLRDSAALSVIGRNVNSIGDPGDIVAGSNGHVLARIADEVKFVQYDHTLSSSLGWTASGHTGTNGRLAGWAGGSAVEVDPGSPGFRSALGTGTPDATTYLRGDGSWQTIAAGGDSITVNGAAVVDADFDDATPAAPAGALNVTWQKDASSPANISAYVGASALLDVIGSTRGSVLYRGASGWAILTPGTSGHFLKSNGPGADPSYASAASGSMTATTVEVDLGSTAKFAGKFTITDASIGATSKVMVWQAPGPYTGKGTRADEAELQPVSIISVEPAAGSAVVKWQTPPIVVNEQAPRMGGQPASAIIPGAKDPAAVGPGPARRIGRVRGNVKFSYAIFA